MGEDKQEKDVKKFIDSYFHEMDNENIHAAIINAMKGYLIAYENKDNTNALIILSLLHRALCKVFDQIKGKKPSYDQNKQVCSFCKKTVGVKDLIAGPNVYICRNCTETATSVFNNGS